MPLEVQVKAPPSAGLQEESVGSAEVRQSLLVAPRGMSHAPGERWPFSMYVRVDVCTPENLRLSNVFENPKSIGIPCAHICHWALPDSRLVTMFFSPDQDRK